MNSSKQIWGDVIRKDEVERVEKQKIKALSCAYRSISTIQTVAELLQSVLSELNNIPAIYKQKLLGPTVEIALEHVREKLTRSFEQEKTVFIEVNGKWPL